MSSGARGPISFFVYASSDGSGESAQKHRKLVHWPICVFSYYLLYGAVLILSFFFYILFYNTVFLKNCSLCFHIPKTFHIFPSLRYRTSVSFFQNNSVLFPELIQNKLVNCFLMLSSEILAKRLFYISIYRISFSRNYFPEFHIPEISHSDLSWDCSTNVCAFVYT